MSDMHPAPLSSTTRDDMHRARQPFFTPMDVVASLVAVVMIWGPLLAGALQQ